MKLLGVLEVHRLRKHPDSGHRELPWDDLIRDMSPAARAVVARVARSEVKNFMAELAEQAEVPFDNAHPEDFVHTLVFHGPGCPGHTTGLPAQSCLEAES